MPPGAVLAETEAGPALSARRSPSTRGTCSTPTARRPGPGGGPRGRDARRLGLQFAPHALRADADVVTKAVTAPAGDGRAGDALSYADEELRANATIVLAAVKVAPQALQHAAPELLADRKFAERAVKLDWRCLASVSKELRADKKLVESALKQSADALALRGRRGAEGRPRRCQEGWFSVVSRARGANEGRRPRGREAERRGAPVRRRRVLTARQGRRRGREEAGSRARGRRRRRRVSVVLIYMIVLTSSHRQPPRRRRAGPVAVRHARLLVVVAEGRVLRRRRLEGLRPAAVPGEERAAGRRLERRA